MIVYGRINFVFNKMLIDLDIKNDITFITGESAVGKTYTIDLIINAVNNMKFGSVDKPVIIIGEVPSRYTKINLEQYQGALIIIDNFDTIVKNQPSIIQSMDTHRNQYVIIARSIYEALHIPIWSCSVLTISQNVISLKYYNQALREAIFSGDIPYNRG